MDRAAKLSAEVYPPYNIEDLGEARIRITIAVAGFSPDQLSVTVAENQLTIAGRREPEAGPEREFLHQGIAARGFSRSFVLADGMEVGEASLRDGLLSIEAFRPPTQPKVRTVPIKSAD